MLPEGILDPGHEEAWETWVELHPETAARLRVKDRSIVRVQSGQGALSARARVTPRVPACQISALFAKVPCLAPSWPVVQRQDSRLWICLWGFAKVAPGTARRLTTLARLRFVVPRG